MFVVDASVVVAFFIGEDAQAKAAARLLTPDANLWAPHLLDAEVGHALRRAAKAGLLEPAAGAAALADVRELPVQRVPYPELLSYAWGLRDNVSFYDAIYVALAQRLGVPLVTLDARLGRAASGQIDVVMLGAN